MKWHKTAWRHDALCHSRERGNPGKSTRIVLLRDFNLVGSAVPGWHVSPVATSGGRVAATLMSDFVLPGFFNPLFFVLCSVGRGL